MKEISPLVRQLLVQRGIPVEEQEAFLQPDFDRDTHDPLLMKGMAEAVARVKIALEKKENIAVFGDYDADGVPATAVLQRAFKLLGVKVAGIIPTRESGYGLTMELVKEFIADGTQLLITVDNGTVAKDEVAALVAAGVDVIICDHHEPQEGKLADKAVAILNPKQADCSYPFKSLCGCAVAWKLAWQLYKELGKNQDHLKWELDLVALSTIADMVPLVGENRVLACFGLTVMKKSRNLGLQALAATAGVNLKEVSAGVIGFRLAPRINAPSRMRQEMVDGSNIALQLLTTQDSSKAFEIAGYLHIQNSQRQALLDQHVQAAFAKLAEPVNDLCLVLYNPEWSSGVIGLLAGRLVERYGRPVVILALENGVIKGSVRSVNGIDAVELIAAGEEVLEKFGGHKKAAGLTFSVADNPEGQVEVFSRAVRDWMGKQGMTLDQLSAAARRVPDLPLELNQVTLDLVQDLKNLEPYGMDFPEPLFVLTAQTVSLRKVGKQGQHLSCVLQADDARKKAIGFGLGFLDIQEGATYEIYANVMAEEWQGRQSAGCQLYWLRKTEGF